MTEEQNPEAESIATETSAHTEEEKTTEKTPSTPAPKKSQSLSKDQLIESIKQMTVLELSDLIKALEEEFGVSAVAPVAVAPVAGGGAAPTAEEATSAEEQTEFSVILASFGESKVNVIRAVREVTALGLKEAKELVEAAPKPIKEGIPKDEANGIKEKLEALGATVEIK